MAKNGPPVGGGIGMTDPECAGGGPSDPRCSGPASRGSVSPAHVMCDPVAPDAGAEGENNAEGRPHAAASPPFGHSASMEFSLIREVDADILEQGVEEKRGADLADFDDEGHRLHARAESNTSLIELEDDDIVASAGGEALDLSAISHRSDEGMAVGGAVDESSSDGLSASNLLSLARPLSTENVSMPAIAEDSIDVGLQEPQANLFDANDFFLGSISPQSPGKPQVQAEEINHEAIAKRKHHHRSSSFDRRVNESAQFAEAVGEEPDSLLLKKIIEEDSSSDYDDDEIDERDQNLLLGGEDGVGEGEGPLTDVGEDGGEGASEQLAGAPSQEKIEPTCVSTDLGQMAISGDEGSPRPTSQEPGELPQVATPLDVSVAESAPPTPSPSPCKPDSTMPRSFPTSFHPPCYVNWKYARQNSTSSNLEGSSSRHVSSVPEFDYRGIQAHRLEITKRGMARGNYAQLHRKAWLEVSDKHHRYGKNLRLYYKHWETLGHPADMFFDWLDSKGEATGDSLPDLPEIPRPVLDSDTVLYITDPDIQATYALDVAADPDDGSAIIVDQDGKEIKTGKEGWIFVLRDHVLYGSEKVTEAGSSAAGESSGPAHDAETAIMPRQRFHHSSFFAGKAVASAGIFITNDQGRLTHLYPHSGHYRPGEAHMQRALYFFQRLGVELSTFAVDMQQLLKVSRKLVLAPKGGSAPPVEGGEKAKGGTLTEKENKASVENGGHPPKEGRGKHAADQPKMKKSKKTDCLHLMVGAEVACFLAHKAVMIELGVFHQIHQIRRIPKESRNSVSYILGVVNN